MPCQHSHGPAAQNSAPQHPLLLQTSPAPPAAQLLALPIPSHLLLLLLLLCCCPRQVPRVPECQHATITRYLSASKALCWLAMNLIDQGSADCSSNLAPSLLLLLR